MLDCGKADDKIKLFPYSVYRGLKCRSIGIKVNFKDIEPKSPRMLQVDGSIVRAGDLHSKAISKDFGKLCITAAKIQATQIVQTAMC